MLQAFLYLRWRQSERERPYRVPGGWAGAVAVVGLPAGCALAAIATSGWKVLAIGAGVEVLIVGTFYCREWLRGRGWCMDARAEGSLEEPLVARSECACSAPRTGGGAAAVVHVMRARAVHSSAVTVAMISLSQRERSPPDHHHLPRGPAHVCVLSSS